MKTNRKDWHQGCTLERCNQSIERAFGEEVMKRTLVLVLAISAMLALSACSHMPDKADASADNSSSATTTAGNNGSDSSLPFSGDKEKSGEHKGLFSHPEDLTVP